MTTESRPQAATAIDRAVALADRVLFPAAQDVDRAVAIPSSHLAGLADAGLFGIAAPRADGGLDLGPRAFRRVVAAVGGGCGATFFVWVQHHGVVRTIASSANETFRDAELPALIRGERLAGVAFAHVRRPGRPAITARRVEGGWQLDGRAPWATSWGMADWFAVAAEADHDQLVWAMIAGDGAPGVVARPLALPVLGATGTVALEFERCVVPDAHIVEIEGLAAWRVADRRRASIGQPAVLGVAERALGLLGARGDDADAVAAAERLRAELAARWRCDDELVAALAAGEDAIERASDHRAGCLDLGRRATTALLASVGGHGMELDHPAQRLMREADFYVIQAQTAEGRASTLRSV